MGVQFFGGVPTTVNNTVQQSCEKFYISYNWNTRDYGVDTTAFYIRETGQFLILSGDHRKGYDGLDFSQSLDYFYANVKNAVPQSEHGKVFKIGDSKAKYVNGGY